MSSPERPKPPRNELYADAQRVWAGIEISISSGRLRDKSAITISPNENPAGNYAERIVFFPEEGVLYSQAVNSKTGALLTPLTRIGTHDEAPLPWVRHGYKIGEEVWKRIRAERSKPL